MHGRESIRKITKELRVTTFRRELLVVVDGLTHTFFICPYGRELVTRLNQESTRNNREALKSWASKELKSMGISRPISGMRILCVRLAHALETYDYIGND